MTSCTDVPAGWLLKTDRSPDAPSPIMALLARVWPTLKLIIDTPVGTGSPPGKNTRYPAPVAPTTVTLMETAFAPAGIPHSPTRPNVRMAPAANGGGSVERVSTRRHGDKVKKVASNVGVEVRVGVGVIVGVGVMVGVNVGVGVTSGVTVGV